ncbi:AAA family ATPase [Azospirillum brasilense]|nr:AAA family ATPase [Azospirillum brasilense]
MRAEPHRRKRNGRHPARLRGGRARPDGRHGQDHPLRRAPPESPGGGRRGRPGRRRAGSGARERTRRAGGGPFSSRRAFRAFSASLRLWRPRGPANLERAPRRFRYHRTVFIAPPWPEIFVPDAERRQTLAEAAATYDAMVATYGGLGYELVELPKAPVAERLRFVLDRLAEPGPLTPAPLTP